MNGKKLLVLLVVGALLLAVVPLGVQAEGQAGTTLSASKTATGFWEQYIEYDWTVEKSVSPESVTVKPGETATVTYTIVYERTEVSNTSAYGVRGEICVTNGGDRTTENLKLVDQVEYKSGAGQFQPLAGATQTITPDQLGPGESACYPYEITFTPVAGAQYRNSVKITITNHSGRLGDEFGPEPKAEFSLPTSPTLIETDEAAHIVDVEYCPAGFTCTPSVWPEEWDVTDSGYVSFDKDITNDSAECGNYYTLTNTVTLTESDSGTERTDSAEVAIDTGECPPQYQGCTPGYWKNHLAAWAPTGYSPSQKVSTVFTGAVATLADSTLLQALNFKGGNTLQGAQEILLRAAVAALLDAAHPGVNYPLTPAEIITQVNAALASANRSVILNLATILDGYNNAGCPLN